MEKAINITPRVIYCTTMISAISNLGVITLFDTHE